ncbi:putative triacylglycerol lipase [Aspergillus homomorphus CBS 101889]|uniref:Carboxylic ester hydrolase n=1 Tax=Aspergillus homomorphus (strain CBS 101889) TaxID=1450537 RepID=A0A395HI24_ASPHC|nr:alpha/beta-hydrolase [Aspergillus homomorphus CBS 101889]RAL07457.1 alpha/beta-hydrolase [Aspergillus homomorphus CBS 101889]
MRLPSLTLVICLAQYVECFRNVTVDLGYSQYRGQALANGIVQWLGIRYAAPPVGSLRFAAPQDPERKEGIQTALQHGPLCIPTDQYPIPAGTSEDCLFLDVYAPNRGRNASKLPVFVFIQGGGFNADSNANFNGTGLIQASKNGIVVLNFNYRVGPYGFLSGAEVLKGGSVNNGLKDQIKVLQWVQSHISKFGGDPKHVVIGGDSAGAASITLLLSAYGGEDQGLFHAAAAESQSFATMLTANESQFAYNNLVIRTGCASEEDTLSCLRELDTASLQRQNIGTPLPDAQKPPLYFYAPSIDGDLVPDYTYRQFSQGHFIKVPVIFGDVTNEGTTFVPKSISSVGEADTFIQSQFPAIRLDQLAKINHLYLAKDQTISFPNAGLYWRPTSNAYGELRYNCPGIAMSTAFSQAGMKSWNYHYAVQDPDYEASGEGVYHVVELNAIWGPQYVSGTPPTSYFTSNAAIIPVMQGYWTSFIKSFDPNLYRYPGSPEWETWSDDGDSHRRLFIRTNDTKMEMVPLDQRARCDYLISIGIALQQ